MIFLSGIIGEWRVLDFHYSQEFRGVHVTRFFLF